MICMFIKMSSGWHGKKIKVIKTEDVFDFVNNGEIVAFAEDAETFALEMGIEEKDIIW